jgi:hypothetical protein
MASSAWSSEQGLGTTMSCVHGNHASVFLTAVVCSMEGQHAVPTRCAQNCLFEDDHRLQPVVHMMWHAW